MAIGGIDADADARRQIPQAERRLGPFGQARARCFQQGRPQIPVMIGFFHHSLRQRAF